MINKFYDTESRINALVEIFQQLELTNTDFDEKTNEKFLVVAQRKWKLNSTYHCIIRIF